jgi:ABC-type multidrug transport system fused ATPase/permease subunit
LHAWNQYGQSQEDHRQRQRLIDVEDEETSEEESISDLALQKTFSHGRLSIVEVDRPRGEMYIVAIEVVVLLAQVGLSLAELAAARGSDSWTWTRATIANTLVWTYITVLATARLLLSTTSWKLAFARLWNHTAVLYGAQWILQVWIFRSALIKNVDQFYRSITVSRFALTTFLLLIALCSRRGNRGVALEYDGDIEPSREPTASLLSLATFGWVDTIVWQGYKRPLELADVWNVALKDKAEPVLASFRQVKKTHGLALRLLLHFKKDLLIQGAWCMMASVFMFMPTLLLKAILEYLEDSRSTPITAAWLYVILLFVTGAIQAVGDGQALWIGRKITIRLRAIIVGEVYSKTLRRKAAATAEVELGAASEAPKQGLWNRLTSRWRSVKRGTPDHISGPSDGKKKSDDSMASNGTIINLMSIDSFKVADICAYLHFLWAAVPVQLVMAVLLLYNVLGFSSLAGIGLMAFVLPLNMFIARSFQAAQKRIMSATDKRIHSTNEVLQNIRIIKYFAWEQRFKANVDEKRAVELSALWKKYVLWSFAATIWSGVPILITFVSFTIYTLVEKRPLVPSVAFPALSMFSLLRIPLDQLADMVAHVQESKVSVDRVEEFLNEEETEKYQQLKSCRRDHLEDTRIGLTNATLTWGSKSATSGSVVADAFRLINIDVHFEVGKLNVIAGPTGSGKTSLLMALLGEMKLIDGKVHIPGGAVRKDLRPDPATGLTESVAFCAQQPWLVNATIKENILFASPLDSERYDAVLSACALERDLQILDAGDQTLVGEKGITLSGGQKQRISLARAIYSNSKHLLLDDCLSAVDSHTAKHIFEQALTGMLMINRTCILVSHNVTLTVPEAAFVAVLQNGKIASKGSPEHVMASGSLGDDLVSHPPSRGTSVAPSRVQSSVGLAQRANGKAKESGQRPEESPTTAQQQSQKLNQQAVDHQQESKATGSIKAKTIKMYLQAMGPWHYWILAGAAFIATQVGSVATNVWIRQWANAYQTSSAAPQNVHGFVRGNSYAMTQTLGFYAVHVPRMGSSTLLVAESPYGVDVGYYLGVYALLGIVFVGICLARELVLFWGSLAASRKIHDRLLYSILRAKFRFFDSTPLGQMTNRFSKDVQSIDQEVAPVAIGMLHSGFSVITIVVLISVITPGFLGPGLVIGLGYVAVGSLYIRSSRDLKRIEAVQRSPLFQHFGETLSGVVTIRAYGEEARFMEDSHYRVNTHNRPFIYLWATNRWLAFRMDIAGAFVSFFSGVFVVINAKTIDAGAAGLALSYAITFTQNVLWLVRLYAANEQNMNSVERIQEYADVDQEAPARVPENAPAANWPTRGSVEFINYGTRYRTDLDRVLKGVTFKIAPGEKIGVVGRTGAGKSSLALALFRGLEAEEGKILIDDVDIGLIGLQDLREAITIVPQDPTLFTGTLRNNLDPFELFSDEEIFAALTKVQLVSNAEAMSRYATPNPSSQASTMVGKPSPDSSPNQTNGTISSDSTLARSMTNSKDNKNVFLDLSTPIAESGSNLSQGQRQLVCLSRALLKSPKVLVMDEATASIDYATDTRIQSTLRELKNHTLITIAHRLQTIVDYDKILVLDHGEVVEYADPWELLQKEGGSFRSMCMTSGQFDSLLELAKKASRERRLVDDD